MIKRIIKTPQGLYTYKLKFVYEGIKKINKEKAKQNLLLFNRIARKNNLRFGLFFGTFLGAIRDNDFIEHDEDIDLFILKRDKELFLSMLFELRKEGFEVIRFDRRGGMCSIMRNGEYMDISFFEPVYKKIYCALSYFVPENFVLDLAPYSFCGEVFFGPKDCEDFLLFWYGESWRTPIQRDNFNLPIWKKYLQKIKWYLFYSIPDCLFKPIIKKRRYAKMLLYNQRVDRFNKIKGYSTFHRIPL